MLLRNESLELKLRLFLPPPLPRAAGPEVMFDSPRSELLMPDCMLDLQSSLDLEPRWFRFPPVLPVLPLPPPLLPPLPLRLGRSRSPKRCLDWPGLVSSDSETFSRIFSRALAAAICFALALLRPTPNPFVGAAVVVPPTEAPMTAVTSNGPLVSASVS
ncbi:hypothetical protein M758_4G199300 [Ceratodon purpureus]|nr:hypothetical protein M758_4G199300 [Ceratodon purpureus]